MKATFKQYSPQELYIPIVKASTLEAEEIMEPTEQGYKRTGGEFFDTFMKQLYKHGRKNASYHAHLLGIPYGKLCVCIQIMTGMPFNDFIDECTLLFADDLLKNRKKSEQLKEVAKRLGFGTYSSFYHFMVRYGRWEKKR